jgi:hypothetical protein
LLVVSCQQCHLNGIARCKLRKAGALALLTTSN